MVIEGWGNKGEDEPRTSGSPSELRTPSAEGTPQRRGDFTKQEYERRQQLKLMEDLGKVLKPKPTTVRDVKKQARRTVFRDDSVLSNSPARGFMGKCPHHESSLYSCILHAHFFKIYVNLIFFCPLVMALM